MNRKHQENRIKYLEHEFRDDHLNSDELISPTMKSEVNKKYYDKNQLKDVDDVLSTLPPFTGHLLKKQVYYIVKNFKLKDLCRKCKLEVILAVIIIFVWKDYNKSLKIDDNSLWKKYDLNWRIYGIIIGNLLRKTRENNVIKLND